MIVNANLIVQHVIQNKNLIRKQVNVNVNIILSTKTNYSWNPSSCTCEKSKYLKSIADTYVTYCDEIVIDKDNISIKKTNAITTNDKSTALINWYSKNSKRLLYFV